MIVKGRYPVCSPELVDKRLRVNEPILRSENITTSIIRNEDGTIVIRLDDKKHLDFWMEITLTPDEVIDLRCEATLWEQLFGC
jgi:hypothetical protein